ncbi:hypothetical protein E6C70_09690 [Glaciibacter flavus]|uniref:Uncharacterized protein n=1 Tax=Orlajensenia flava TaxID=2565934 RepID=A0A4V3WU45_9MICO|nr:hypothetical protein E6C70_09690 [Glaciibacter flavus]
MAEKCDQCLREIRRSSHPTATRTLCDSCYSSFMGLAAGYMAGGTMENAISTQGWFTRLRSRPRPNK